MRNRVSDDMINVMLRQMGAASIKTTPTHINVAKFLIGDDLRLTYMYEVKEEEIYLQRISPYPMMIGKIYNEQQVVDIISGDLKKFKSAYKDVNFNKFLEVINNAVTFDKEIENLFMNHGVSKEDLDIIENEVSHIHDMIEEITSKSKIEPK